MRPLSLVLACLLLLLSRCSAPCQDTAAIDTDALKVEEQLEKAIGDELAKLRAKTNDFAGASKSIAIAIGEAIEKTDEQIQGKDFDDAKKKEEMTAAIRKAVRAAIRKIPAQSRADWGLAYNNTIKQFESKTDSFDKRRAAYQTAAELLIRGAEEGNPESSDAAIKSKELDGDRIADKIATTLRDDKRFQLMKFDTEFQRSISSLVAALQELMRSTDAKTTTVKEFKENTGKAVFEVISGLEQATKTKERWKEAYNLFVKEAEQSQSLDATTAEGWNRALAILIVGLKRAAGIEAQLIQTLANNKPTGGRGRRSSSGSGSQGFAGGYSNTIHGARTARRVSRILNRMQVQRARIYRYTRRN